VVAGAKSTLEEKTKTFNEVKARYDAATDAEREPET
jgi:hypothetical protein